MIVTIPINVLCFFPIKILTGGVTRRQATIMRPPRRGREGRTRCGATITRDRSGCESSSPLLGSTALLGYRSAR